MTSTTDLNQSESQPSRLDALIDAIVDGVAQGEQWDEFRALAGASHEPWRRLAEQQRLMKTLEAGFDAEVRGALAIELPARQAVAATGTAWSVSQWRPTSLGWAAAMLLGLAWAGSTLRQAPAPTNPVLPTRDALLAQYMAQPHVVGELPVEIRDVSHTPGGDVVTYVRQIVERQPVNLYDLQLDENSNPVLRKANSEPVLLASRY